MAWGWFLSCLSSVGKVLGHTEPPVPFPQVGSYSSLGQAPTAGSSTLMVLRVAAAAGAI